MNKDAVSHEPSEWEIRCAQLGDADEIAELHAASWRSAYKTVLNPDYLASDIVADRAFLWHARLSAADQNQQVVIAKRNDELLGFACAYLNESSKWGSLLDNLHVKRDKGGLGIGTSLLRTLADRCYQKCSGTGLYLWVIQDNLAARRFYMKLGARNGGSDVWNAPGGTKVPRFRFIWTATQLFGLSSKGRCRSSKSRPCGG